MNPHILIITLYCGENEYEACKQSVQSQSYAGTIDHIFIENLPNIEAHRTCYQTFMDRVDDYNLFIKLDADMVLTSDTAIKDIIGFWTNHNRPDHMVFAVHDCIPDRLSIGIHVFSNRCTWDPSTQDRLFVDPNPQYPGHKIKTYHAPAPFVSHMPSPSHEAAFHFGAHRAQKALQPDRFWKKPQGLEAFRILMATANHYKRTLDERAELALMGAESMRRSLIQANNKDAIEVQDVNIKFWLNPLIAWIWWVAFYGIRAIPIWAFNKLRRVFKR